MLIYILLSALLAIFCHASFDCYRLPRSIEPQHYNLRILTHLEDATRLFFSGEVEISLRAIQTTRNITLHAGSRLNILASNTYLQQNNCDNYIKICDFERNPKYDFYILHLETNLQQGRRYLLRMQFWARLDQSMSGYYASSYVDNKGEDCELRFISVTQFEPANARTAFPCFDEPHLKATFNITLGHQSQYNALSNMPILERIPICDRENWVWSTFKETKLMSTYLVAYSINDFESLSYPKARFKQNFLFTTWARASVIEQCQYATKIGPRLLKYYEEMFNIKYPLPKMDQLAVPDFSAGAMENWGLITYRESSLFYAERASSQTDKQHVANVIAHELAHQWFGNLVTMEWWNDLWLNEGFATYVATLGVEKLCCKWNAYNEDSLDNVLTVLNTDAFYYTRPIHQPVGRPSQIAELFDAITYRKGAVIIRMMHIFIGDEAFRKGLNCYLINHSFSNAKQEDLWLALTNAAHQCGSMPMDLKVQTVMDTWTLQNGFPLLTVQRHYNIKAATITQVQYRMQEEPEHFYRFKQDQLKVESCWFVPISYTTQTLANFMATKPCDWLRCTEYHRAIPLKLVDLPGDDEWLILNLQLTAPYRVNYDNRNWELIISSLKSTEFDHIHEMNRAQLIDDSLALAWSGHICYTLTMELMEYLSCEVKFMPWRAALDQMTNIERIIRQTCQYKDFVIYMLNLLEPIYCHLEGMNEDRNERHHVAHKTLINKWACHLQQEDCVGHALRYFHRWFISNDPDGINPVPQNLRSVVYCTAVRQGDVDDWKFLWQRYRNTTVASERRLITQALSCTQDEELLRHYLELTYRENSPIRKQDASQVFGAIVHNAVGYHLAKDFYMQNFEILQNFYLSNSRELVGLLNQISQHVSSKEDFHELKSFIEEHKDLQQSSTRGTGRALEQAQLNVRWRQEKLPEFVKSLLIS